MIELRPFQKRFLKGALAPNIKRAALSLSRGNGKSTLAAYILQRCLTPGDSLFQAGAEYLLLSGSLDQARQVFNPLVATLDEREYRFTTSTTRLGVFHKPTGTTLRVVSSKGKTAFGLGANNPICIADEPGVWEVNSLMDTALDTALGKPGSDMRVLYIGTLAPATSGFWHDMIADGTHGSVYVQAIIGDPEKWDRASEIRRCNPLMWHYPESRAVLMGERDDAFRDTRLKARFLSFRLNCPSGDESTVLLTTQDWELVTAREPTQADGRPIVGIDLGGSRAWSSAVAIFPSGLVDAIALTPGVPAIEDQERRDHVPRDTYRRLVDSGLLLTATGLRVPTVGQLWAAVMQRWGKPSLVVSDRFRLPDLEDATKGSVRLEPRVVRWSESSEDIRALRKIARDGPMSASFLCRPLLEASLAAAAVKGDDSGGVRLVKKGTHSTGRDDVAAALTLAAGAWSRKPVKTGIRSLGLAG